LHGKNKQESPPVLTVGLFFASIIKSPRSRYRIAINAGFACIFIRFPRTPLFHTLSARAVRAPSLHDVRHLLTSGIGTSETQTILRLSA
jgi:hypothetical protein